MAKTIRELRQQRGWIQFELAVKLGVQPGTIANWERGRTLPRVTELKRLAQLFGVCREEIVLPWEQGQDRATR
jgi:transcriptional regulator with XRE-family HTH domain